MKNLKLSLIVPVYNEEALIKQNLDKIVDYLSKRKYSSEIIVVDDGSNDNTYKILKKYKNKNLRIFRLGTNQGKGSALKKGFLMAFGEYCVFTDADLSVDIQKLKPMLGELQKGGDVVIGSRRAKRASIDVAQPKPREMMGRVFTKLTQFITKTRLSDYTCGFKGFSQKAAKDVFSKSLIDRWAYDAEILFLAHKYDYKIVEIPVSWKNRKETKVKIVDAIFTSFRDLLRIRYYDSIGKYEK